MKPELGNVSNNLVKMSDFIADIISKEQKVDVIVFPELVTSGYELGVQFTELAQRIPGPAVNLMAQRAADAGVYIAFGLATKEKVESILYNSAVLIGPEGELLGGYHKVHLRGEERMAFREGFKLPVIETGEIGKIGLMIGYDLAFPEVARTLALEGAELLLCLANWEMSFIDEWKTYLRARAYENAIFIAAANRIGQDVTMRFGGESMIVGPRGKLHAALELEAEIKRDFLREQQELLKELQAVKELREKERRESKAALEALEAAKNAALEAVRKEAAEKIAAAVAAATSPQPAKPADSAATLDANPDLKPDLKSEIKLEGKADMKAEAKSDAAHVDPAPVTDAAPKKAADPKKHEPQEGYCLARIDLDEVRRYREEFQTLQSRQPTAYKPIVKRY
jgi:predicted amidohydrolase